MNLFEKWSQGLAYDRFLAQYGTPADQSALETGFGSIDTEA